MIKESLPFFFLSLSFFSTRRAQNGGRISVCDDRTSPLFPISLRARGRGKIFKRLYELSVVLSRHTLAGEIETNGPAAPDNRTSLYFSVVIEKP